MPHTKHWYKFVLTLITVELWEYRAASLACFHLLGVAVLITNMQYRFADVSGA